MSEEIKKSDLISYRDGRMSDVNFIFSTVLRGLFYGDTFFSLIPKDIFMKNYHVILERLLQSPKLVVKVACLKDDEEVILGYSLTSLDGEKCHFVFVKSSWRKVGIARNLVPATIKKITHYTSLGMSIAKKKNLIYDPFALE